MQGWQLNELDGGGGWGSVFGYDYNGLNQGAFGGQDLFRGWNNPGNSGWVTGLIPENNDPGVVGSGTDPRNLDMTGKVPPPATIAPSDPSHGNLFPSNPGGSLGGYGGQGGYGGLGSLGAAAGLGGLIFGGQPGGGTNSNMPTNSNGINFGSSVGTGLALGSLLSGLGVGQGGTSSGTGAAGAQQRNLPAEITALLGFGSVASGNQAAIQGQLNPYLTNLNADNFTTTLGRLGGPMRDAFNAANPQLNAYNGELGSTLNRLNGQGVPKVDPTGYAAVQANYMSPQAAAQASFNSAGPASQAAFNSAGSPTQAQFNAAGPTERAALNLGGPAAQATFNPAQAFLAEQQRAQAQAANQQRAQGGPLLGTLQSQAMQSVGGVSDLQKRQQDIAMGLLGGTGGDLSAQDLRNVQQDTRGAFAARGLYDSNQAIGAEIMNSDAARRARLTQNLGIAQGVDAAGQSQIGATRNFALGVQNQGQNLSQFNAGQGNQLGMFNTGQANQTSQFNAGQGNALNQFNAQNQTQNSQFNSNLGAQVSMANAASQNALNQYQLGLGAQNAQFNAGQTNANQQFNAGQANNLGLANMGAMNQGNQFNAGQANNLGMYNSGQTNQGNQFNAGQANALGVSNMGATNQNNQFWANLGQNNAQFNAGQTNAGQAFSANATNALGMFNANLGAQNANDQWARSLGFGNYLGGQAINPTATAMGLQGQAGDYTGALLGYGNNLYDTNLNASAAAQNSRSNNNAALTAAGLNMLFNLYGRPTT